MASSFSSEDGSESAQNDLRLRKSNRAVSICLCETFLHGLQETDQSAGFSGKA